MFMEGELNIYKKIFFIGIGLTLDMYEPVGPREREIVLTHPVQYVVCSRDYPENPGPLESGLNTPGLPGKDPDYGTSLCDRVTLAGNV
jgi:hypothetical protein